MADVHSALDQALVRVPLVNGACAGPDGREPDLAGLAAVVNRGLSALQVGRNGCALFVLFCFLFGGFIWCRGKLPCF